MNATETATSASLVSSEKPTASTLLHAAEPLSPLAMSILDEVRAEIKARYAVDFTIPQIASAVITAQGVEGCADVFGVIFAAKPSETPLELGLQDPPLDAEQST